MFRTLFLMFMCLLSLMAQSFCPAADASSVAVRSTAYVLGTPETFVVKVEVALRDRSLQKLRSDLVERCGKVLAAARQFELDAKKTFTDDFSVAPIYPRSNKLDFLSEKAQENPTGLLGYYATQKFQFAITQLDDAEALTMALLEAGATTISDAQFEVADANELWMKSRQAAVKKAHQTAVAMTSVLDAKPGRPLKIVDQGTQRTTLGCAILGDSESEKATGGKLPGGTDFEFVPPTAIKFQSTVTVDFQIVDADA